MCMLSNRSGNSSTSNMWKKFQISTGLAEPEEQTWSEEISEMTSLSWHQRLIGFFMSLAMGITFIIIAMTFVPMIALFGKKFAFFFTCGNLFCVASTAFLVGPKRQMASMFESHRAQVAATYVAAMLLTMISALQWRSSILSIVFAAVQVAAVVWYGLSYIPFARRVVGFMWGYLSVIIKPVAAFLVSMWWSCCKCFLGRCLCPDAGGGGGGAAVPSAA